MSATFVYIYKFSISVSGTVLILQEKYEDINDLLVDGYYPNVYQGTYTTTIIIRETRRSLQDISISI